MINSNYSAAANTRPNNVAHLSVNSTSSYFNDIGPLIGPSLKKLEPSFPAKEPRDVSCCNKEWRDKGEKELNRIHRAIKSRLKACNLDPTDGEGPASCVNIGEKVHGDFTRVNEKLACWTCVLERRYKRTILLGRADHWAIVCQSYKPDKSIDKKIVFDLWKPKFSGKTPEDGFYEEYPNRWENDGTGSLAGFPAGRLARYPQPPDPGEEVWEPGSWADIHLDVIGE
ncbi:MAG: hypothetical protein ACI9R3_003226 [Verrucomicrobiales bacterium]